MYYLSGGREHYRQSVESVAIDTASREKELSQEPLTDLAVEGLRSFHFFAVAYSANESLAEHILATCAFDRCDPTLEIILGALRALYRAPAGWAGNETWGAGLMVCLRGETVSCIHAMFS